MPRTLDGQLVVAVSSRALFDFEEENAAFSPEDDRSYRELQLERLHVPARPGVALPLVKKLLDFNRDPELVEVVILSRNDPISGLRVLHSAEHGALPIKRSVFTGGRTPYRYLKALGASLFLSANADDVREALNAGFAAARVFPDSMHAARSHPDELRIAFDGDAVLFSDQAECVYQSGGLAAFELHERRRAREELPPGPFKPLLQALHQLKLATPRLAGQMRIRTALVTSRSAPAHERALRTLMAWNVEVDEAMFLGGLDKSPFLKEFEPDFFFDDQTGHCTSAARVVPSGHVIAGIMNRAR